MRSLQAQITRAPAPEERIRHMRLYGDKSSHSVIITVLVGNGDSVAPMPGPGYSQRTAGQSACVPPAGTIPDRRSASPAWGRAGPAPRALPRHSAPGAPCWAARKPGHQEMDKPNMRTVGSARATFFERSANLRHNLHGSLRARLFRGASFGPGPALLGKFRFRSTGTANIGARFMADGRLVPPGIFVSGGATLSIGTHFYMNAGATIEARHDVQIGDHVLMGPFASIIDDDRHEVEPGAVLHKGRTVVGSNVWLGRSVAVMPGVTIGDGSVIGTNSVVTRDIPPDSFAAGAPARVIRKLDIPGGWVRS